MRMLLVAVVLLLTDNLSYGKTPAPLVPADKPNHEAEAPQKETPDSQRGTEQSPVVVKILPAQKDEAPPSNADTEQKGNADWWLDHSPEIFIALFTLGLWCATYQLVREAKGTAKKELRAYMGVAKNHILRDRGANRGASSDSWEIVIQNFGKTMAKDTRMWISTAVTGENITRFPWADRPIKTVVMPGETLGFHHDIAMPRAGDNRAYLWGKIEYDDVFGKHHWTTFRFMSDQAAYVNGQTPGWKTKHCDEGNDAGDGEPPLPLTS